MGYAGMKYKEVRFIVNDELTEAYVLIEALGDYPLGVQGWHHRTFPPSQTISDIIEGFRQESPVMWSQEAPREQTHD